MTNIISRPFKRFLDPKTQIVKHGKWYTIAPLSIIAIGLLVILIWNFNLGLDFTGGRIVKVSGITDTVSTVTNNKGSVDAREAVREALAETYDSNLANRAFFQQEDSDLGGIAITARFPDTKDRTPQEVTDFSNLIKSKMDARGHVVFVEPSASISASASSERIMNVFLAVFASLIGILLYMLFRFRFTNGVAAIVGLFHDVLVMLALVAIFRIQMNFVFVAAAITVVAYSLNNTLVLFDRVRDKERDVTSTLTPAQKMDASIKETFWRTMITTVTTLIPVTVLCIFGVTSLREFALPIVFGLAAGTYSTICITSTLYVRFENARQARIKQKLRNA